MLGARVVLSRGRERDLDRGTVVLVAASGLGYMAPVTSYET